MSKVYYYTEHRGAGCWTRVGCVKKKICINIHVQVLWLRACGVLPHNKLVLGSKPRQALFVKFVNALEATYYKTIYSAEAIS